MINLKQAAESLGVCAQSALKLIKEGVIKAEQVVACAPWAIAAGEIEKEEVKIAVERIKQGENRRNQYTECERQLKLYE